MTKLASEISILKKIHANNDIVPKNYCRNHEKNIVFILYWKITVHVEPKNYPKSKNKNICINTIAKLR
jgi:hypothetical protein